MMLTTIFGLSGALVFGSADFLGGLASRRISAVLATAVGAVTGLIFLLLLLPVFGGTWKPSDLFWGALSGVAGALAISLLYACLAIGPMSILSPLTAVASAIVPLSWGLLGGERLGPFGYLALGLALVAVILVGFVPEKSAVRPTMRGIVMAALSGMFIGLFLILMDQTSAESGLVPLAANRATSGSIMVIAVGVVASTRWRSGQWWSAQGRPGHQPRTASTAAAPADHHDHTQDALLPLPLSALRAGILLSIVCGVVDVAGNSLLLLGIRLGDLSVMSVLTAMYPAGTILLAALVLRERIAPVQWLGLILALVAAGMLALG